GKTVNPEQLQATSLLSNVAFDSVEKAWVESSAGYAQTVARSMVVLADKAATTSVEMLPIILATDGLGYLANGYTGVYSKAISEIASAALEGNKVLSVGLEFHFVQSISGNLRNIFTARSFADSAFSAAD